MKKYLAHEPLLNQHKHCHHNHHEHSHEHADVRTMDKKILKISLFMTASMMIVQFIYSLLSNSLALLSDTLHMFSDVFALALSFLAILAVQNFKNEEKTFGYFRLEILVAFINSLTIILSAIFISYEAIEKFLNPVEIDAKTMVIVASIGLLVNAFNAFLMYKGANLDNINMKSAFLHMISDLLGSLVVVVGGIFVYYTKIYYIDTVLALILSFLLLRWSIKLLRQSVNVLLESSPVKIDEVRTVIFKEAGVKEILDLHITQITNKMYIATMHLEIDKEKIMDFQNLSKNIAKKLHDDFEIGHCTIEPLWKD